MVVVCPEGISCVLQGSVSAEAAGVSSGKAGLVPQIPLEGLLLPVKETAEFRGSMSSFARFFPLNSFSVLRMWFLPTLTADILCGWKFNLRCNSGTGRVRLGSFFSDLSSEDTGNKRFFQNQRKNFKGIVQHLNCDFEFLSSSFLLFTYLVKLGSTSQSNYTH